MTPKKRKYAVNIDMVWSKGYNVLAKSHSEAKKIAWERFKKHLPKKQCFTITADKIENL